MSLGSPSVRKTNYVCFKLWKESHTLWIKMKRSLGLKSEGTLACHLLNTTVTVLNKRNFTEAQLNDLNQRELFYLSAIVGF